MNDETNLTQSLYPSVMSAVVQMHPAEYKQVILVTGGREWANYETTQRAMEIVGSKWKKTPQSVLVIHGECRGADRLAGKSAKELGYTIQSAPADWKKYGRSAGYVRNAEMIEQALEYHTKGVPTTVLAFHSDIEKSKGTKHCIEQAKLKGLDVILVTF